MEDSTGSDPSPQDDQMDDPNQQPQTQPEHQVTRRERRHHKKVMIFSIAGAALVLLLAGGAYWFFMRGDTKQPAASTDNKQEQSEETALPQADPTPVAFKSTKLNIEITHRKDWVLKESASGEFTITSPKTSYVGADGQSMTGVFTVKVRKGVTDAMKATIDKAVAARDSEVIAYAAPAEAQRQYTNLSYAGTKDAFSFFIVTGNAALKAGNAFAYTLPLDGEFYLIVGGYGSDKSGNLSFDPVPVASMDSETLQQAVDIVESLKIF